MGGHQAARGRGAGPAALGHRWRAAGAACALRAQRIQSKAARVNFDWPDARAAWAKVEEEMPEAAGRAGRRRPRADRGGAGDVLFSLVNVARLSSLDAEDALHGPSRSSGGASPHGGRSERPGEVDHQRIARRARAVVGGRQGAGARAMKVKIGPAIGRRRARRHHRPAKSTRSSTPPTPRSP